MFLNSQEEPLKATLFGTTVGVNAKYLLVTSFKIRLQCFVNYTDSSDTHVASITRASKIRQTYSQTRTVSTYNTHSSGIPHHTHKHCNRTVPYRCNKRPNVNIPSPRPTPTPTPATEIQLLKLPKTQRGPTTRKSF